MIYVSRIMIAIASFCLLTASVFAEPANLGLVKKDVQAYHDSGAYDKELSTVIEQARRYMLSQIELNKRAHIKKNLAIVLDIDETSLSNYKKMVKREFVASRRDMHREILAANAPPIMPVLALYRDALKAGVKVFFVTGRPRAETAATKANLLKAGYKDWSGLFLRPDNYQYSSIVPFKAQTRAMISKKGYTIIASIGDQYSDLLGGFTEKGFKLPNPFYYLP